MRRHEGTITIRIIDFMFLIFFFNEDHCETFSFNPIVFQMYQEIFDEEVYVPFCWLFDSPQFS